MRRACNLKRPSAGDERLVLERVFHRAQPVPERVLDLLDRVRVRPFDEEREALGLVEFFFFSFPSTAWSHTKFLRSTIFLTFASTNRRSASTSFSRCSADE